MRSPRPAPAFPYKIKKVHLSSVSPALPAAALALATKLSEGGSILGWAGASPLEDILRRSTAQPYARAVRGREERGAGGDGWAGRWAGV
eukprot:scaffold170795_cov22-Tisochrysis_lutea.AAC.2